MDRAAHKQAGERAKRAVEALRCCKLCPRQCGVDRIAGEKGYCRLDDSVRCFREVLHWREEQQLIPSHQVYFAGCNLRCEYCTVSEWNNEPWAGEQIDIDDLVRTIARRRHEGAKTLNLLGGEPAVNVHGVLELLARLEPETQVVWNSNMYYNEIVDELMAGLVDVYLPDLKCGSDQCAEVLLGADDYVKVAKQNILRAQGHADVIVRHFVLPGHDKCCLKPVLSWLVEEMPDVKLSLRGDYVPPAEAVAAPTEYLRQGDFRKARNLAGKLGLNLIE
jgi:putative pyruvate formate lyase activating enzyme